MSYYSYFRDKMLQAYEFALDKVGLDFNSYQARVSEFLNKSKTNYIQFQDGFIMW